MGISIQYSWRTRGVPLNVSLRTVLMRQAFLLYSSASMGDIMSNLDLFLKVSHSENSFGLKGINAVLIDAGG